MIVVKYQSHHINQYSHIILSFRLKRYLAGTFTHPARCRHLKIFTSCIPRLWTEFRANFNGTLSFWFETFEPFSKTWCPNFQLIFDFWTSSFHCSNAIYRLVSSFHNFYDSIFIVCMWIRFLDYFRLAYPIEAILTIFKGKSTNGYRHLTACFLKI